MTMQNYPFVWPSTLQQIYHCAMSKMLRVSRDYKKLLQMVLLSYHYIFIKKDVVITMVA